MCDCLTVCLIIICFIITVTSAFIKTPFGFFQSKDHSFFIGSVTDGKIKVEVRIAGSEKANFEKGQFVKMTGKVLKFMNNPPYIMLARPEDCAAVVLPVGDEITVEEIIKVHNYAVWNIKKKQ